MPFEVAPFPLSRVRLLDGPWRDLQEYNRSFLHGFESDRLLHTFRFNAGLPSRAEPLAGWERPDIELRGHFTGHYLSACALMQASARDEELKLKAGALVSQLGRCQKALGNGYLSAFPSTFLDRLRDGLPVWAPWYTLHKIMAGLLDMYVLASNEQALAILQGMADYTDRWAETISDRQMARILEVEFGGIGEVLYNLHAITGRQRYGNLAQRFAHERILEPLAEGRDQLKGLHVNTTIPKIIAEARRYELTGDSRSRKIAEFFWHQVTILRSYCTGGTSNFEHWRSEPGKLGSELSDVTQECCCTYNMLKLTRQLFSWTAEARYADYYERAMLNGILGTMNPEDGMTMYYVPMASGYWKMFSLPRQSFWCCTGTGAESFAKLGDSIYFHDDEGIFVNLFAASDVEWPEKRVRLRQETEFPANEHARLVIQADAPVKMALRIRKPYWAGTAISLKVNGQATPLEGSSYMAINRLWHDGDVVDVTLGMELRAEPLLGDSSMQAFCFGPLVLAGELGSDGLTRERMYGDPLNARGGKFLRGEPAPAPAFQAHGISPSDWIRPVANRALRFQTTGQQRDITLIPFNQLFGQRYAVYWRVAS